MVTPSAVTGMSRPTPARATPLPTPLRSAAPLMGATVQRSVSTPLGAVTPRNATPTAVPGVVSFMTPPIPSPALVVPTRVPTPTAPPSQGFERTATYGGPTPAAPSISSGGMAGSTMAGSDTGESATPPASLTPRRTINPFLKADPGQRARRLARALVSDLVAYHPKKRDEGLGQGTLRTLFREDIKKSYEEYVEQVGREIAESTPHFQEALNDILASGQRMF